MTGEQLLVLGVLLATIAMFLWGRWRHDMVAVAALLACVAAGLVSFQDAFAGFGHPAVVTVACVLVLSQGLQNSGVVDALARRVLPSAAGPTVSIAALTALAALLSGFMNNVGALALLMPVALQVAARQELPPGRVLMPLAFGSILGGMTTLVGTPPNLIVSGFRGQTSAGTFAMFDFTPVGFAVALAGVAFVALIGWRLVPARRLAGTEGFETGAYLTEARVPEDSKAAGMPLGSIEAALEEVDAQVIGLVRNEIRLTAPSPTRVVRAGDILVIEAEAPALANALSTLGVQLEEAKRVEPPKDAAPEETAASSDEIALVELAVLPGSPLVGRSASDIRLRTRHGLNLLALSRQGRRSITRLRTTAFSAGDVLLMQGAPDAVSEFAANWRCVPLAARPLRIPDTRQAVTAGLIMAVAVGVAAFGLLPAAIAFAAGVLASMALRTVPPRSVYDAVDWPVIVLLAALIPVAGAMERTGAADVIGRFLLEGIAQGHPVVGLAVILVVTMTLSDVMNNAATAAVMCPVAIGTATQLGASADPYLMAVAIGASCAFLTPIGHQNNTLILGPGGFRFGDYWRLGLPLEILVLIVSIPMLLMVWPP
ncbi:MAG TPA: SLC13 family permease [Methylomirabilota bacterium]|nr:SLC13 family permease [Methylomirabilota bacterium]